VKLQQQSHGPQNPKQGETKMAVDFATLKTQSMEELRLKTEAHQVWGFGKFDRWNIDQEQGDLIFSNADGTTAVCAAQIIGTYNDEDQTFLWAWANESIHEQLIQGALTLREYGEEHHIDRLTAPQWTGTKDDAWELTALAVKLCEEQGAYAPVIGQTTVFITFAKVKLSKKS